VAFRYLSYLDRFAAKYDLLRNIRFRTAVKKAYRNKDSGKWVVTVKGGAAVEAHRTYGDGTCTLAFLRSRGI
jgi:cation diffusion facilitator CzcD-associated flavoprotein CzcO